jgi:hypothetical protein
MLPIQQLLLSAFGYWPTFHDGRSIEHFSSAVAPASLRG